MITKEMCQEALKYSKLVYKKKIDIGMDEFLLIDFKDYQVLSFEGSNGFWDWFWNFTLFSKEKMKLGGVKSAERVFNHTKYKVLRFLHKPLRVTGHSRGGVIAPIFFKKYCDQERDSLIVFNPPPGVRKSMSKEGKKLKNSIAFRNKHDIVDKAGELSFDHWNYEKVCFQPENQGNIVDDHILDQWDERIEEYFKEE